MESLFRYSSICAVSLCSAGSDMKAAPSAGCQLLRTPQLFLVHIAPMYWVSVPKFILYASRVCRTRMYHKGLCELLVCAAVGNSLAGFSGGIG